jgi:hypothetical protein
MHRNTAKEDKVRDQHRKTIRYGHTQVAPHTKWKKDSKVSEGGRWRLSGIERFETMKKGGIVGIAGRGIFLIEKTLDPSGNPGPRNPMPSCPVLIERALCFPAKHPRLPFSLSTTRTCSFVRRVPPLPPPAPAPSYFVPFQINLLFLTPDHQHSTPFSFRILILS